MKKEEKKVVKKESKSIAKETKKVEKVEKENSKSNDGILFTSEIKKGAKILATIVSFFATLATIFVFVFGIITSLKAINLEKSELLHDNFSVTFISNLTGNSITETENIIKGYGSKTLFVVFDIVLPAIAFIAVMILLVIFTQKLLSFVTSINKESELFTKAKLIDVEKLLCLIATMITITLIIFGSPSIIIYALISLLLFIIIALFEKCIKYKKDH